MTLLRQRSISPRTDLREMLRQYIVQRSLCYMEQAAARREAALSAEAIARYRGDIQSAVRGFYGVLPAGPQAPPPEVTPVSTFAHRGFRIENVLFSSFPGWQVNATVYIPTDYAPPFIPVVVPVGHSGKQFPSYQLPCQYFARSGFLAITFDPPGQAGEKQSGNDHFTDGVRDYLLGETSSRYFIADALRCIDYLATREDADLRRGVAMTGVSGGGTTTTFAALLDERITVIGPSCCVTPLADLDIAQCYAGCPETHQFGRYAEGIDEVDLLCAATPTPCLLMAGAEDTVFHIDDTLQLADTVAEFYTRAGAGERFAFFADPGGHAYTLTQAEAFARFMRRWLQGKPDLPVPSPQSAEFPLLPHNQLRCYPRADANMRTLAVAQAAARASRWDTRPSAIRQAAAELTGMAAPAALPELELGPPFQVWSHNWQAVMLRPEGGIELPATLLTARRDGPAPAVLHLDPGGRHRLLHRQGLLTKAIGFLEDDGCGYHLLAVDLRGWGDTEPAVYPYEMAGWGATDRYLAYASAALGDHVLAMRIRDALAALAWLKTLRTVDSSRIVITASGVAGIVALHVAALDDSVAGVVVWNGLSSFGSLLAAEHYPWPADTFLPRVLRYYDLPELAGALSCPVRLCGLQEGSGHPAPAEELTRYERYAGVAIAPETDAAGIAAHIRALLAP